MILLLTSSMYGQSLIKKINSTERVGYTKYNSTAYCLTGRTASGRMAGNGTIAVDPRVISIGSKVKIEGLGTFTALDTGGAIKGRKIDIWMSCSRAMKWGRRTILVKIL